MKAGVFSQTHFASLRFDEGGVITICTKKLIEFYILFLHSSLCCCNREILDSDVELYFGLIIE